jgi:predicted phosphate transport protein (TIGR00153 family)
MLKLMSGLMPREGRFFEYFDRHATLVLEGSTVLAELLKDYQNLDARAKRIERIEELEHAADRITRDTVELLHTTFVTPLDRDDIHRLISRMDDVLDLIQDTAEALNLYDIQQITSEACDLAELLKECCVRMQGAARLLSSSAAHATAVRLCNEIDGLESQADRVLRAAISKLFREERDVRQLLKLEAIYQLLESATDRCEDVANVIEGVLLEQA